MNLSGSPVRRLLGILWRQSGLVTATVATSVLAAVCLALILITAGLVAEALAPSGKDLPLLLEGWDEALRSAGVFWPGRSGHLAGLLVVAAALAFLRGVFSYLGDWASALAVARAIGTVRRAVFRQAYKLGRWVYSEVGAAQAIELFTREAGDLEQAMRAVLWDGTRRPLSLLAGLIVGLAIAPVLMLLSVCLAALAWMLVTSLRRQFDQRRRQATSEAARQLALLQESMFGMRVVQSLGVEAWEHDRFCRQMDRYEKAAAQVERVIALERPYALFWAVVGGALYLGLAAYNVIEARLSLGGFVSVSAAVAVLYGPVSRLIELYSRLPVMQAAAGALGRYLDARPRVEEPVGSRPVSPLRESLRLEHVSLRREGGEPVLVDIDLEIRAGQRVAIVGTSALEKRALVDLIVRLTDPSEGVIRYDGQDLRTLALDSYRQQVALVPGENLLFDDTVYNNIGCGDARFDLEAITQAAKAAHAHHFIKDLPLGYQTEIGAHGVALSGGQRHRLGLARAFLRQPSLLVVEEPTAPLDDESATMIDEALARFLPGRTLISVAHRLATVRQADLVVVLDQGRLAGRGTHRELTAASDLYRHIQYTEFRPFSGKGVGPRTDVPSRPAKPEGAIASPDRPGSGP